MPEKASYVTSCKIKVNSSDTILNLTSNPNGIFFSQTILGNGGANFKKFNAVDISRDKELERIEKVSDLKMMQLIENMLPNSELQF